MLDWDNLRHFAALAEAKSLAGAARMLRVEHATIARRVAALEVELGVKLVDRRGRKIELTPTGLQIAVKLDAVREQVLGIERVAASAHEDLTGTVTVSSPPALAAALLGPILAGVREAHPGLVLQVVGEIRQASLDRREADIAIRLGRPSEGEVVIRKLGEVVFRLYGNPDYLGGTVEREWSFIAFDESLGTSPQQLALKDFAGGRPIVARARTIEMQAAFAEAKIGIAMLPEFLASGRRLVPIHNVALRREVWLVVHSDLRDNAAVQTVSRSLSTSLAKALHASSR